MRKKLFISLLLFLVIGLFASCAKGDSAKEQSQSTEQEKQSFETGTYSNLLDEAGRKEVKEALQKAGISSGDIEAFFEQVNYFNESVNGYGLITNGFKEKIKITPDYDPYEMQDLWDVKNPNFMGYNCRITSYVLMKNLIEIGEVEKDSSDILVFDENSIENGIKDIFNQKEKEGFKTLYHPIATDDSKNLDDHLEKVQNYWKSKKVVFKSNDVKLITVFFHEEDGYLFVGHVGVLVPDFAGNLFFIEKVAFQEPYQVIRFKDRVEMNEYLMKKYDNAWGQNTIPPFIMENDELMEGYRALQGQNDY